VAFKPDYGRVTGNSDLAGLGKSSRPPGCDPSSLESQCECERVISHRPKRHARRLRGAQRRFSIFWNTKVIPFVDRTYRTIPSDRGLLGHSYGGLFAIYALEQRPALFQRIVAASPALSGDNRLLFSAARQKLRELPSPVRLDISVGGKDDFGFDQDTIAFAKLLDELKPAGLDYRFTLYPDENHDSVRLVSLPEGLYWVYRATQPKNQIPE